MKSSLVKGARKVERTRVDEARTIGFLGEEMRLYSTPSMVRDVEYASLRLLAEHLDEGESSVGIHVAVDHLGATPLGHFVEVEVTITSVEGRKVTFEAEVRDAVEIVGRGKHVRFIIDVARHAEKLRAKMARLEPEA